MKWFLYMFCVFTLASNVQSNDDVATEITALLKDKNVKAVVVFLLDFPREFYDSISKPADKDVYNGKYFDLAYLKKKVRSREYLGGHNKPNYDSEYRYLGSFANLLFRGKRIKLDMEDVRALLKTIVQSDNKPILTFWDGSQKALERFAFTTSVPEGSRYTIAQGILIVLSKGGKPVFAFDIKSPEHVLVPPYYSHQKTARFYKLHLDDKGRLFMFDSFLYKLNDKINRLSAKLWRSLDIGVVVRMKKYYELPVNVIHFYANVPQKGAGKIKLCDIDKFPELFYGTRINTNKAFIVKWRNDIKNKKKKMSGNKMEHDERLELQDDIANLKERISDAQEEIPELQRKVERIKAEIQKRKTLYKSLK